ncbi:alcohol oxidase [Echria macrotheca]|uniref:Alcohol oxidase n=1 Tax=Echria macrotheca TaxID=438768 RepID=A0AAJ0BL82_9PEZI|nr:alcohol oxidase [Echria macrotheca]
MWPLSSYPELSAHEVDGKTYDYVIVGGGTAGCVLASRLSEDPSVTVLVLEKGRVRDNLLSRMPLLSQAFRLPGLQSVKRKSEPVAHLGGAKMEIWSAEAIGGATRINGMLLTRGVPGGYQQWATEFGLDQWSWDKVEPYFRRSENAVGRPDATYRGHDGPVENRLGRFELGSYEPFKKSAEALGLPIESDLNNPKCSAQGCFDLDQTIDAKGTRLSAYRVWLNADIARKRRNHLSVCTGVVASRLVLNDKADTVTAVQIQAVGAQGKDYTVKARREVILCGGALCTPQLLMLSGIGPNEELNRHGIPVRREFPWVGDLLDHVSIPIMVEMPRKDTLHIVENILTLLWHLFLWLVFGTGVLGSSSTPTSIFYRTGALDEKTMTISRRDKDGKDAMDASQPRNIPNVEVMLIAIGTHRVSTPGLNLFSWYTTLVQPFSHGRIRLYSANPQDHPKVQHPVLDDERDRVDMRRAARFSMHLAEKFTDFYPHPAPLAFYPGMDLKYLDSIYNGTWKTYKPAKLHGPVPGGKYPTDESAASASDLDLRKATAAAEAGKSWRNVTDEEIDEYCKRMALSTLHYSSTCRMSAKPEDGVVDQRLRVHGFQNLRIADASVFPYIPSGHTMAPSIMVAERCADFLKDEWDERKGK